MTTTGLAQDDIDCFGDAWDEAGSENWKRADERRCSRGALVCERGRGEGEGWMGSALESCGRERSALCGEVVMMLSAEFP